MDCISRTGTRAVLGCSVSTKLLLGLYHISRTDTGAVINEQYRISRVGNVTVVDCRVSVGLVLGQYMTVGYQ